MKKTITMGLLGLILNSGLEAKVNPQEVESFAQKVSDKHQLDSHKVKQILSQAKHQQSIIDAMNRPAEKTLKWFEYRNIFLKSERINKGVQFWEEHEAILNDVSAETGVPAEIIVAIIGVETYYGKIMGSYKVLDALYTLSFDYPKRSKFFSGELEKFLLLLDKENLSYQDTKGSYAGAMGFGQFIPSSYLAYAVDYDKDGQRDLLNNKQDAIASVANYFKQHGWKKDQPVIIRGKAKQGFTPLKKQKLKPSLTVEQLQSMGYSVKEDLPADEMITLTQLDQKDHKEYWFGLHNFYVITRYNHSEMYAMAVYQLAQEIKALKK